jgi:hypothetical protein
MHRLSEVVKSVVGKARGIGRRTGASAADTSDAARNYDDERETSRLGGMSEEDRAWEAASQERNTKAEARDASPPERN